MNAAGEPRERRALAAIVELARDKTRPPTSARLDSLDGVGPSLLPLIRLDFPLRPWFGAQAGLAGLGTRPTIDARVGSAAVAQTQGLLGGRFRFRAGDRLVPFAAVAAGVLHTLVEGHADAPNSDRGLAQWSLLLDR